MTQAQTLSPPQGADEQPSEIMRLRARTLRMDRRVNTRDPSPPWIAAREGQRFSPGALGVLTVSRREEPEEDPGDFILDGQNRWKLVLRVLGSDAEVDCKVYWGLTRAQEAKYFLELNDDRVVGAIPKHKARVTAGDHVAVQIEEIARKCGYRIEHKPGPGVICCIQVVTKLHTDDKGRRGTRALALERTLTCITQAWKPDDPLWYRKHSEAMHQTVVKGLGQILVKHGDVVDVVKMTKVLAAMTNGPEELMARANGVKGGRGVRTVAPCVSEVLIGDYNLGKKTGKLPHWLP